MKVKVRTIDPAVAPTPALQTILRRHAHDKLRVDLTTDQLYEVMDELVRRREREDPNAFRSDEEALAELRKHYMPRAETDLIDPNTGIRLTPSPQGRDCLGNGEWPGYECCCDECDHYLACFPEYDQ